MENGVWTDSYEVASFLVDDNKKLKVEALVSLLQESAVRHGMKSVFGFDKFIEDNKIWIKTRFSLAVCSMPVWGDNIRIETWVKEIKRIFFIRDFYVKDKDNNIIARASGTYTLMDTITKRPQNICFINDCLKVRNDLVAYDEVSPKIRALKSIDKQDVRTTRYSDVDFNGHISNIKYIKWMLDLVVGDTRRDKVFKSVDINYLSELQLKDEIKILMESDGENIFFASIYLKNTKTDVCRARFEYSQ